MAVTKDGSFREFIIAIEHETSDLESGKAWLYVKESISRD